MESGKAASMFRALLLSLPAHNSTLRMRLWRSLKSTGCAVLRDGVYILPPAAPQVAALLDVETEVKTAGGFAMTVDLNVTSQTQLERVRKMFDRADEYGALLERINRISKSLRRLEKRKAAGRTLEKEDRTDQEEPGAVLEAGAKEHALVD